MSANGTKGPKAGRGEKKSAAKAAAAESVAAPIIAAPTVATPTISSASADASAAASPESRLGDRALSRILGIATFLALFATQAPVGFTRDEGYYFSAASSYEEWIRLFLKAPLTAMGAAATERFFRINSEHPALAKMCFAASHLVFSRWLGLLGDTTAWRMPAWVFGGILSVCLARLGFTRSRAAGVLAPLLFWCAERTFFHGHLACFDIPICALFVAVALAWARALGLVDGEPKRPWLRGLAFGLVFGCALATKHNAWFLPPVLFIHALLLPGALRLRALKTLPWILLGPVVLVAVWPLLWHGTLRHLNDWISFHLNHVHYSWWYLGDLLRQPPFPISYPIALLALTLPITTVALLFAAALRLLWRFARRTISPVALLELGIAGASLLPFMLRTTPIFGGIKHWLVVPALLAPEAGQLLVELARDASAAFPRLRPRVALVLAAAFALAPGLAQIARVHPYGTSAYGELAGDEPGAASLGMQRQYWSGNVTAVLPWINAHAPMGARIFFHEVNGESFHAYQLMNLLRRDLRYAGGPGDAEYAVLQWHREFRDREPETWNAFRTTRPATGLYLEETPQIVVYARPGLPGAP